MKINIIFPCRDPDTSRDMAMAIVMPLAPMLLAALTPRGHDVRLVDMLSGDRVDYDEEVDVVALTVRTPLATVAYEIADLFLAQGRIVVLGGPHVYALPAEARAHASAVAIGEAEQIWPRILEDIERGALSDFYVCGPYPINQLQGKVVHEPKRPSLVGIPMMRRDLLPRKRYLLDSLFTTRGCPNACNFCPVSQLFGGKIRHRPIDEVVAEVDTLGKRYFNVDDSVFGHPQMTDRPEENQYYLDLYRELARLRPKRVWTGAGGIAAINYPDGRKILELAVESGLSSISAGLESISATGQEESGAWRKLHYSAPHSFELQKMKENIRTLQSLGIEILGFFIVGWDGDTVETFRRTLDFCDECGVVPFILPLTPMPGSKLYDEYLAAGRILPGLDWEHFGDGTVVFKHPTMSAHEMADAFAATMREGYSWGRIWRRTLGTIRQRRSLDVAVGSFFTQYGIHRSIPKVFGKARQSS